MKKVYKTLACILAIAIMLTGLAACDFILPQETIPQEEDVLVSKISMNSAALALKVGETGELTATVNLKATNKNVIWSSSDETIVTVAAGESIGTATVTAVAAGEATITATAADGSGVTATCTVTVTEASEVALVVKQDGENLPEVTNEITADIRFNTDGTCLINAFYAGLNTQIKYETTYAVVDGVLTFDSKLIDVVVFGISGQVGTTAVVNGDQVTVIGEVTGTGVYACTFTLNAEQAATLGITVGEKSGVQSVSVPESMTVKSGATFDIKTLVTFAPADATVQDITVTVNEANATSQVVYQDKTNIYPLKAGTIEITVTSVENPAATATMTLTVEAVERPASLATKYFENEKTFAWALNSYKFKTDGSVEIMDAAGKLQVLGYYTLSEDGSQITLYSLTDAAGYAAAGMEYAGTTYNLTKQADSDLLQFDIGELLGMPGVYIALEIAS